MIILALGIMGNMVQSNSISDAFHTAFGANKLIMGIIIAVIAGFIFIGGISRIASFTEKIVPIMAALYLVGGRRSDRSLSVPLHRRLLSEPVPESQFVRR